MKGVVRLVLVVGSEWSQTLVSNQRGNHVIDNLHTIRHVLSIFILLVLVTAAGEHSYLVPLHFLDLFQKLFFLQLEQILLGQINQLLQIYKENNAVQSLVFLLCEEEPLTVLETDQLLVGSWGRGG